MRKKTIWSFMGAALVIISSCCGCKMSGSAALKVLYGNDWSLIEINGNKEIERFSDESFTLGFDQQENRIYGTAMCNRYFGSFKVEKRNEIDFGDNMGSTRMACPGDNAEQPYFQMLSEADKFMIDDNKLILYDDDRVIAVFKAVKKAEQ